MKKVLSLLFFVTFSISAMAVKLTQGDFACLKGQKKIVVTLDVTKTTFKKVLTIEDFLSKAPRAENWKESSINQFINEFNENSYKCGMMSTIKSTNCSYELKIIPGEVTNSGSLKKVVANVIDIKTGEVKASMLLSSDDGDDDDEIALRDAMGELGEQLGKFFSSKIGKLK